MWVCRGYVGYREGYWIIGGIPLVYFVASGMLTPDSEDMTKVMNSNIRVSRAESHGKFAIIGWSLQSLCPGYRERPDPLSDTRCEQNRQSVQSVQTTNGQRQRRDTRFLSLFVAQHIGDHIYLMTLFLHAIDIAIPIILFQVMMRKWSHF